MTQAMPSPSSMQPVGSRRSVPFVIRPQLLTRLLCLAPHRAIPEALECLWASPALLRPPESRGSVW